MATEPVLLVRRCLTAVTGAWPCGRPSSHWAQLPESMDGVHSPFYPDDAIPQVQQTSSVVSKLDAIIEGTCGISSPSLEASSIACLEHEAHSHYPQVFTGRTGARVAVSAALVSICLMGATSLAFIALGWVYLSVIFIAAEIMFWLQYLHR